MKKIIYAILLIAIPAGCFFFSEPLFIHTAEKQGLTVYVARVTIERKIVWNNPTHWFSNNYAMKFGDKNFYADVLKETEKEGVYFTIAELRTDSNIKVLNDRTYQIKYFSQDKEKAKIIANSMGKVWLKRWDDYSITRWATLPKEKIELDKGAILTLQKIGIAFLGLSVMFLFIKVTEIFLGGKK